MCICQGVCVCAAETGKDKMTSRNRKLNECINQGKLYFVCWLFFHKNASWTYFMKCWGKEVGKREIN